MAAAQKDMVARPDAMIMGGGVIMVMIMGMPMVMPIVMGVPMAMVVPVRMVVKAVPVGMIVRHRVSLAPTVRKRRKIYGVKCLRTKPRIGSSDPAARRAPMTKRRGFRAGQSIMGAEIAQFSRHSTAKIAQLA
jgi:hypothetical protein